MKLQVMAVYDQAAEVFGRPFFVTSVGIGVRSFTDEVNRAERDNPMYVHSGDFSLFHLGEFDDGFAAFVVLDRPLKIVDGSNVRSNGNAS